MISEHGDQRDQAAELAHFLAGHLAERFAVAPHRAEQNHEVLHAAAQHGADDHPERAGQIAELRGEHRADQRSRAGDGGEMVAEDDPFIGGHEVVAVVEALGGRGAAVVESQHFRGDEFRIEAVADRVGADGGDDEPDSVQRLAAFECDRGKRTSAG